MQLWPTLGLGAVAAAPVAVFGAITALLRACERSVGVAPPTADMLAAEPHDTLPLFRHCPALSKSLAWRSLGEYPTPVHSVRAGAVSFQVKREDLSSAAYGGNKVRTLEHQLAVCESRLAASRPGSSERRRLAHIGVVGSAGSNQVVATMVHAAPTLPKVSALWASPDAPDLDNTLNMLSVLSCPNLDKGLYGVPAVLGVLTSVWRGVLINVGGNAPSGVLGHVSAALELAEQIDRGEAEAVDGIYLAVGSSCTISGLAIGIALSRHLGLTAFDSPGFTLNGVIIRASFCPCVLAHARALAPPPLRSDLLIPLTSFPTFAGASLPCMGRPSLRRRREKPWLPPACDLPAANDRAHRARVVRGARGTRRPRADQRGARRRSRKYGAPHRCRARRRVWRPFGRQPRRRPGVRRERPRDGGHHWRRRAATLALWSLCCEGVRGHAGRSRETADDEGNALADEECNAAEGERGRVGAHAGDAQGSPRVG